MKKRKAIKRRNIKRLRIGVLMGGISAERKISLITGRAIYKELKKNGHRVTAIDLNSRSIRKIIKAGPDVVINALHGTYGEDGVIQSVLEFLKIPYSGSGPLASALCMDKVKTKEILEYYKIPTPPWKVVESEKEAKKVKLPAVFKPQSQGSAVGVYIVKTGKEAAAAYRKAARFGKKVLAEKYIKGTEITVPILNSKPLPIIEIVPKNEFYDYDAKYTKGKSVHIIPARISSKAYRKAGKTGAAVHKALGCEVYSRVDMIVRGSSVYVLETNTLPGMTPVSLFPEAAKAAGLSFYELILIFVNQALRRR